MQSAWLPLARTQVRTFETLRVASARGVRFFLVRAVACAVRADCICESVRTCVGPAGVLRELLAQRATVSPFSGGSKQGGERLSDRERDTQTD